jgi:flagellar L-ring protein precursor FlgH
MSTAKSAYLSLIVLAMISGCATAPATSIKQPLTDKPTATPYVAVNDGAIYQPHQGVMLFNDPRPHQVGDTLTVNLVENTQISRKLDNKQNRLGNASLSVPAPTLLGRTLLKDSSWSPNSTANTEYKTDLTNNNKVTGSITVTVTQVLDNGNLEVAGEKQVALDSDTQYLRLAGVANPRDINPDGSIDSTRLADVKFESKGSTGLDTATVTSLLARFFLAVLPF